MACACRRHRRAGGRTRHAPCAARRAPGPEEGRRRGRATCSRGLRSKGLRGGRGRALSGNPNAHVREVSPSARGKGWAIGSGRSTGARTFRREHAHVDHVVGHAREQAVRLQVRRGLKLLNHKAGRHFARCVAGRLASKWRPAVRVNGPPIRSPRRGTATSRSVTSDGPHRDRRPVADMSAPLHALSILNSNSTAPESGAGSLVRAQPRGAALEGG